VPCHPLLLCRGALGPREGPACPRPVHSALPRLADCSFCSLTFLPTDNTYPDLVFSVPTILPGTTHACAASQPLRFTDSAPRQARFSAAPTTAAFLVAPRPQFHACNNGPKQQNTGSRQEWRRTGQAHKGRRDGSPHRVGNLCSVGTRDTIKRPLGCKLPPACLGSSGLHVTSRRANWPPQPRPASR